MLSLRPKVSDLVFQLYGRSLHPELFEVHSTRVVERGQYQATVSITSCGHVVSWRYGGLTMTEVGYPPDAELAARAELTRARRAVDEPGLPDSQGID